MPALGFLGVLTLVVSIAAVFLTAHVRKPSSSGPPAHTNGAMRGEIVDRNGHVLARTVRYAYLEGHLDRAQRQELALRGGPNALAVPTPPAVVRYIPTHKREFPNIKVERADRRVYTQHGLAAQALGIVVPSSSPAQRQSGSASEQLVGKSGLEYQYNAALAAGDTLKLWLHTNLLRVGQQALRHAINASPSATGGGFVAMNPEDGSIYAIGSLPTFDPNTERAHPLLNGPANGYPLLDRATDAAGPAGSAFAPITALAALQSGAWSLNETFYDTGRFCLSGTCWNNPGATAHGSLDLPRALRVEDNSFFYNLGALMNADPATHPNGGAIQQWARALGIGQPTGVDLPGELSGTLPTPAWQARIYNSEITCKSKHHLRSCGILYPRRWLVGHNIDLADGQGDLQVTPLQLAVAYAAIANGGTIVRPHVGQEIDSSSGRVLQTIDPSPLRDLNISGSNLDVIREGLNQAAQSPGGSSDDVFGGFPKKVYGMAGTAQYIGQPDYAWFAGYVPASRIVVVAWVQGGGHGARAAAPVARQILSQWVLNRPGPWIPGSSRAF